MSKRVGLYGGSFDPIHHGHLIIARCIAERQSLDEVVFLPSASPPHKHAADLMDSAHRGEMVKLAIEGEAGFRFSDHDLKRSGPTYTIDTISYFQQLLGSNVDVFWIVGADSLAEMATWHRVRSLVDACRIITAARPGWDEINVDPLRACLSQSQVDRLLGDVQQTPRIDISATDIRRRLGDGASIRYLVPDSVRGYIERNGLYQSAANRPSPG